MPERFVKKSKKVGVGGEFRSFLLQKRNEPKKVARQSASSYVFII